MIERIFIEQGMKKLELDSYLAKELDKAGFTKSEIVKTPLVTRIVVNVTRPGLAIGKSGSNIAQLTETIEKRFKIDNPQLEIREIEKPELDAQAVANKLKALIERGFSWRSVVFKTFRDTQAAGAQGIEIIVSGKIAGKGDRKRAQRIAWGYMKKVGEQAKLVDYGATSAHPKVGAIGIKVRIVRPETKFPDKTRIQDYVKKMEENTAALEAADKKAKEAAEPPQAAAESAEEKPEMEVKAEKGGEKKAEPKKEASKASQVPAKHKSMHKEEKGEKKAEKKEVKAEGGEKKEIVSFGEKADEEGEKEE
ncbi:MAG: 30S ribosomal protein S3 [archaeon]